MAGALRNTAKLSSHIEAALRLVLPSAVAAHLVQQAASVPLPSPATMTRMTFAADVAYMHWARRHIAAPVVAHSLPVFLLADSSPQHGKEPVQGGREHAR